MGKYLLLVFVLVFAGAGYRIYNSWGKSPVPVPVQAKSSAKTEKSVPVSPGVDRRKEIVFSIGAWSDQFLIVTGHGTFRKGDRFIDGSTLLAWSGKSVIVRRSGAAVELFAKNPAEIFQEWHEEIKQSHKQSDPTSFSSSVVGVSSQGKTSTASTERISEKLP